ncbi:MAG: GNAT family N-acetyltransferase [Clostridiaceae bacterium]|nr:GNAT family N-acetyltransferase [Clostridiaceae bacterium]
MASYIFSEIKESDKRAQRQLHTLLANAGIVPEHAADFTLGVFDEDYNLVATGSTYENHFHSLAVDAAHRGKGLLSQVLSYLYELQFNLGNHELYLKANRDLIPMFNSLGFREIAPVGRDEVYMGNLKAFMNQETALSA